MSHLGHRAKLFVAFHLKTIITGFSILLALSGLQGDTQFVDAQESDVRVDEPTGANSASDDSVLDVLNQPVNDRKVYGYILEQGTNLIDLPGVRSAEELNKQLDAKSAPYRGKFPIRKSPARLLSPKDLYEKMVKASLVIGITFDCGRCDKIHVNTAGAVLVGPNGLALTNHHVIEQQGDTKSIVAVANDGRVFSIAEVLSASKSDDVALIRLAGDTSGLSYCPMAESNAAVMSDVHVVSNPHRKFFVLTEGRVSRYSRDASRSRPHAVWMEITAEFGAGSSGSGVFNGRGEVIGLVSRIVPLIRRANSDKEPATPKENSRRRRDLTEVILRRCVPVSAIRKRLTQN